MKIAQWHQFSSLQATGHKINFHVAIYICLHFSINTFIKSTASILLFEKNCSKKGPRQPFQTFQRKSKFSNFIHIRNLWVSSCNDTPRKSIDHSKSGKKEDWSLEYEYDFLLFFVLDQILDRRVLIECRLKCLCERRHQ